MLVGDPAYKFIHVEDFGYVVSYLPRTSFGDFQTMLPVSVCFHLKLSVMSKLCCVVCFNSLFYDV